MTNYIVGPKSGQGQCSPGKNSGLTQKSKTGLCWRMMRDDESAGLFLSAATLTSNFGANAATSW